MFVIVSRWGKACQCETWHSEHRKQSSALSLRVLWKELRSHWKREVLQNTGYTGEDSVGIEMRRWRGKGQRREKVRVGMKADIYPGQCVTGSAKSAMMNVLAGINPQCTPPPPSSSAVPLPPATAAFSCLSWHPRTPLRHLSHPLTARSHTLSKRIFLSLSSARTILTLLSPSFAALLSFFLRHSRRIFTLLQLQLNSHYIATFYGGSL